MRDKIWAPPVVPAMLLPFTLSLLAASVQPESSSAPLGVPVLTVNNLRHGIVGVWEVTNATPNRNVSFFVSLTGSGPGSMTVGPCTNVAFSLSPPLRLIGTDQADRFGAALVTFAIPNSARGRSVWSQAVDLGACQVSNMVFGIIG